MAPDVAALLAREIGGDRVLSGAEGVEPYGRDESGLGPFPPDAVVLAESTAEVAAVLRLCAEHRVPVTPRGAGSGMTGGALPIRGGVVLSTERMRRIVEINADDRVAVVEPGVINGDLQAAVEAQGLFYAPDPASLAFCSLGGNVAENAGGPRAFKYGVTRDWTLGLQVALPGGEVMRMGRRTMKGVTGYDVTALFVGSEGTFGVTTEITLRLLGRPEAAATLLAAMPDAVKAGQAVSAIIKSGFRPRALELMDRASMNAVRAKAPWKLPEGAGAALLIELDGETDALEAGILRCGEMADALGALDVAIARDDGDRARLWQTRRMIAPSLREAYRHKVSEDVVVPPSAIAPMLRRVDEIAARHRLDTATFGHAGDGNLHVNLLTGEDPHTPATRARVDAAIDDLFRATLDLRGTLSGEHGIGIAKARYMAWEQSPALLDLQRKLKAVWDPGNLMNPGKVLP